MFGLFKDKKKSAQTKMEEWLSFPTEMGRPPDFSEVVYEGRVFDPATGRDAPAYLVYYKYLKENSESIGCVGPLTWSFMEFDFKSVDHKTILALYQGWLLCFHCQNSIPQNAMTDAELDSISRILSGQGVTVATTDASSFKIQRTTNANGHSWLTIPIIEEGAERWLSCIHAEGDQEIRNIPSMFELGNNTSGAFAHFAFVATLMVFQRMKGQA